MYPNVSSGLFSFKNASNLDFDLEIYSSIGELIYSGKLNAGENQLDLQNQSEGFYYYQAIDNQGDINKGELILIK